MAINYKEIKRTKEQWGIDIVVQFSDEDIGINRIITFCFKNEKQIESEFESRMAKAISNIENDISIEAEPTAEEKLQSIESEITKSGSITIEKYNEIVSTSLVASIPNVVKKEVV